MVYDKPQLITNCFATTGTWPLCKDKICNDLISDVSTAATSSLQRAPVLLRERGPRTRSLGERNDNSKTNNVETNNGSSNNNNGENGKKKLDINEILKGNYQLKDRNQDLKLNYDFHFYKIYIPIYYRCKSWFNKSHETLCEINSRIQ